MMLDGLPLLLDTGQIGVELAKVFLAEGLQLLGAGKRSVEAIFVFRHAGDVDHEYEPAASQLIEFLGVIAQTTLTEQVNEHPAISLFLEAAPKAVSNDRIGALFDPETMKPRITHPPFVDA